MKYKNIYDECKRLALSFGYVSKESGVYEHAIYIDSFGCDFQVFYDNILARGTGKMHEYIRVYLGGRRVYEFDECEPEREHLVIGYWPDLLHDLYRCNVDTYFEESYTVNNSLLELCKKESIKNRGIFDEYVKICALLARENGELRVRSGMLYAHTYTFERIIEGHTLEVMLIEKVPSEGFDSYDSAKIFFDKKCVFSFSYNCADVGSLFNEKGHYTLGEWGKILKELIEEK